MKKNERKYDHTKKKGYEKLCVPEEEFAKYMTCVFDGIESAKHYSIASAVEGIINSLNYQHSNENKSVIYGLIVAGRGLEQAEMERKNEMKTKKEYNHSSVDLYDALCIPKSEHDKTDRRFEKMCCRALLAPKCLSEEIEGALDELDFEHTAENKINVALILAYKKILMNMEQTTEIP